MCFLHIRGVKFETAMAGCSKRLKFPTERNFDEENGGEIVSDGHKSSDDDSLGGSSFQDEERENSGKSDENEFEQNSNVNAMAVTVREEGEATDSDSEGDLRTVLNAKMTNKTDPRMKSQIKVKTAMKSNKDQAPVASTSSAPMPGDQGFQNFMEWMDQYKQFKEWEASKSSQTGTGVLLKDKAIQSPSESTIYTRLCKSLESNVNDDNLPSGLVPEPEAREQLIVERVDCSSTASTIDDFADTDVNMIDDLILEARRAATVDSRKRKTAETTGSVPKKIRRDDRSKTAARTVVRETDLSDDDDEELKRVAAEQESKARRDRILLDAELHRAQLLKPGKFNLSHLFYDAQHKSLGSHVDKAMQIKNVRNEYIELKDLLPRRKGLRYRDNKPGMKLVNDNGQSKWVEEDDETYISSYKRWEEAFEIYASIYIKGYPHRAHELYDYKHCIRDAANTYIWENVFDYDVEFRLHMARCKGNRSWSAKLEYEYSRYMKNLIQFRHDGQGEGPARGGYSAGNSSGSKTREICRRYNKGRCSWGERCRYLHVCKICKKRGHGAVICRFDKGKGSSNDKNGDRTERNAGLSRGSSSSTSAASI